LPVFYKRKAFFASWLGIRKCKGVQGKGYKAKKEESQEKKRLKTEPSPFLPFLMKLQNLTLQKI